MLAAVLFPRIGSVEYYAQALSQAHSTEVVSVDGRIYTVRNGSVFDGTTLNSDNHAKKAVILAYKKTIARREPLMAITGPDPASLSTTIKELTELRDAYTNEWFKEAPETALAKSAYPIEYLSEATALEQARLTFLRSGSEDDARAYDVQLSRTISAYKKDVAIFRTAFTHAVLPSVETYATDKKIVSRDGVLQAISTLQSGVHKTESSARSRAYCFARIRWFCRSSDLAFAVLPTHSGTPPTSSAIDNARATREILHEAGVPIPKDEPTYSVHDGSCARGDGPSLYSTYTFSSVRGKNPETRMIYVGDIRYVPSAPYVNVPFYKYFFENHVAYVWNAQYTYYKCPELDHDLGTIFALRAVREFATQSPLSSYIANNKTTMQSLERQLARTDVVNEYDAENYISAGQTLATQGRLPENIAYTIASLSLQLRDHSAGYDDLLRAVARMGSERLALSHSSPELGRILTLDISHHFYPRTPFLAYFGSDNESIVGIHGELFRPIIDRNKEPYIFYSQLSAQVPRAKLISDTRFYYIFHHEEI